MEGYIYSYFPKDDLDDILRSMSACSGLQAVLIDDKGAKTAVVGGPLRFCESAEVLHPSEGVCLREHFSAAWRSSELGEPYIFCCRFGLYNMTFPLVYSGRLFGAVKLGPFLMEDAEDIKEGSLWEEFSAEGRAELSRAIDEVPSLPPERVSAISRMMYWMLNSLVSGSRELQTANQKRMLHQSRINEAIQRYKFEDGSRGEYPLETEELLMSKVRSGSIKEARAVFNDLLAKLLLYEAYDMDSIKIRLTELCSLLSRTSIERGADSGAVLELNKKFIRGIMGSRDINDIGYIFAENIDIFTESLFFSSDKNSRSVKRATELMYARFSEKLSLADVAEEVGVSPSHLSRRFKEVTGRAFGDYLNAVRVEEAKRLLSRTDYPIMDIAVACGFNDQSYFTKVFRKYTGLSPKKYR